MFMFYIDFILTYINSRLFLDSRLKSFASVLSAKEVFQLMHSQNLYFLNWENWVQLGIIINVVMVSFHTNPFSSLHSWVELVSRWQHHAAAIGVFLVWGELMLMVGRLPTFGKNILEKF